MVDLVAKEQGEEERNQSVEIHGTTRAQLA